MSQIRILHIIWSASMGGIGRVVFNLSAAQKHNPSIIPSVLIAKSEGELLILFKSLGIRIYEPGFLKGSDKRKDSSDICKEAFAANDIIHFHSYNPVLGDLAIQSRKKIIYTEHGNFAFGRKVSLKDYVVRYLQNKFLNNHINLITFNSEFTKSIAIKRYGLEKINKHVVYNGCPELSSTDAIDDTNKNNKLRLLTIGRLAKVKRIDRLIKAFAKHKHADSQLTIVGDGPLKSELEKLVHEKNLSEYAIFTGTKESHSMIRDSDICIYPSQNEAFGLVAIEAYQHGKAVIVFTDGGGLAELVNQVEPELVVESEENLSALLDELKADMSLLNNQDKIEKRKKFASEFTIEKMEASLSEIYFQIYDVRN